MAPTNFSPTRAIRIDGTTLEGGGQLFRLALCLGSLSCKPIHVTNVRGNRGALSSRGQDGGIKPAHLAGALWLANATQAVAQGLELKSRELLFTPKREQDDRDTHYVIDEAMSAKGHKPQHYQDSVWKNYEQQAGGQPWVSVISMQTPGSVFLILQAILPYILYLSQTDRGSQTQSAHSEQAAPVRLIVKGGTNVWNSLSFEYAEQVLFPILRDKLGIGPITMTLDKRGWSMGTQCIGSVTFDIVPLRAGQALQAFHLRDRGDLVRVHASVIAPNSDMLDRVKASVLEVLRKEYEGTDITFPVTDLSGHRARLYLLLVAETSNGYRLGRDWLFDWKVDHTKPQRAVDALVGKVTGDLRNELSHGGCVDEFLQDQLTVFQALTVGKSTVQGGKESLHTETARWVCEKILRVSFDEQGHCEGVGLTAGGEL